MGRVERALVGFAEVISVEYSPAQDNFIITYYAPASLAEQLKHAAQGMVVAPGARKFMGSLNNNRPLSEN